MEKKAHMPYFYHFSNVSTESSTSGTILTVRGTNILFSEGFPDFRVFFHSN